MAPELLKSKLSPPKGRPAVFQGSLQRCRSDGLDRLDNIQAPSVHTAAPKARKATSLVSIAGSDRGQPMDLSALWRGRGAPAVPESGRGDRGLGG